MTDNKIELTVSATILVDNWNNPTAKTDYEDKEIGHKVFNNHDPLKLGEYIIKLSKKADNINISIYRD
jgi:hypothetical protein